MLLEEIFDTNKIVLYPGRFQPPHPGHIFGYHYLCKKFGSDNVYITMTNVIDNEKSPFSFSERKEIFNSLLFVPKNKILQVKRQYNVEDIQQLFKLTEDFSFIFAVSQKDMQSNARFNFTKTSYWQEFKDGKPLAPSKNHGHIITYPTKKFTINNQNINSASQFRELFRNAKSTSDKKKLFVEIYGKYDMKLFHLFLEKL